MKPGTLPPSLTLGKKNWTGGEEGSDPQPTSCRRCCTGTDQDVSRKHRWNVKLAGLNTGPCEASKHTPHGVTLTHSLSSAAAKQRLRWSNQSRRCIDGRLKDVCNPISFFDFFQLSCSIFLVLPELRFVFLSVRAFKAISFSLCQTILLLLISKSFHPPPTVQSYFH